MEAFLDLKLRPMNVFSSATKFLLQVPNMILEGDSSFTPDPVSTWSSASSNESPKSLARALKIKVSNQKYGKEILKYKEVSKLG